MENNKYKFELNLIGKIQIKNILMALLAANKTGIDFKKIIDVIHKIKPAEGRLEKIGKIKNNNKFEINRYTIFFKLMSSSRNSPIFHTCITHISCSLVWIISVTIDNLTNKKSMSSKINFFSSFQLKPN